MVYSIKTRPLIQCTPAARNALRRGAWLGLLTACLVCSACAGLVNFSEPGRYSRYRHTPRPSHNGTVVVRQSDTLYSIAFRNDLDYRQLAAWNHIGSNYTIYPGQRLRLTPPRRSAGQRQPNAGPSAPITPAPMPSPAPSPPVQVAASPAPTTHPTAIPSAPIITPTYVPSGQFDPHHWQWPTQGAVSTGFDPPNEKGVNIEGQYGQSVVAAAPGTVVYSGNALKGYGELIIIKHSDDYLSAYGFNSRRVVHEGQQVRAGQLIAQMGEGPGQKAELHFEIRYKGQPVDPRKYLPKQ